MKNAARFPSSLFPSQEGTPSLMRQLNPELTPPHHRQNAPHTIQTRFPTGDGNLLPCRPGLRHDLHSYNLPTLPVCQDGVTHNTFPADCQPEHSSLLHHSESAGEW